MIMKDYFTIDDKQRVRIEALEADYKALIETPDNCRPMIVIKAPRSAKVSWEEKLASPEVMLKDYLDSLRFNFDLKDDSLPLVRVDFGTAAFASAFGCEIYTPPNNLPACRSHSLKNSKDVYKLEQPGRLAGLFEKVEQFSEFYLKNLPEGVHIQHIDIQSAFNTAYLIRGNDIMTDFYDAPEDVEALLDIVTDYMIAQWPWIRSISTQKEGWFYDWGVMWKGAARLSNCCLHMISPQFYIDHIKSRDQRFLDAVGTGRMHYCGSHPEVMEELFTMPGVNGLDYDGNLHDLWKMSEWAPKGMPILDGIGDNEKDRAKLNRLMSGDVPKKRNIIYYVYSESQESGREIYEGLKKVLY